MPPTTIANDQQQSTLRRWVRRLGALLVGGCLAVAGLELALRLCDPYGVSHFLNMPRYGSLLTEQRPQSDRLFAHPRNASVRFHGWSARTDSRGLRGPERSSPKPPGVRRILFLGDSLTFGWGVAEEDTLPARAESLLRELTGDPWESVNGGHLYHDTTQERGVLEEVGFDYEPDLVCVVWCGNDVQSTAASLAAERTEHPDPEVRANQARLARFHSRWARIRPYLPFTWATLHFVVGRREAARFLTERDRSRDLSADFGIDREAGWESCKHALREMQASTTQQGVPLVVLDTSDMPALVEFCEQEAIAYTNIAATDQEHALGLRNSAADAHFNRLGNTLFATKTVNGLAELGLIETAAHEAPAATR